MGNYTTTTNYCDNCRKNLKSCRNNLNIVTFKEKTFGWSRLCVKIEHQHGVNNDITIDPADLCPTCAIELLQDAVKRIQAGERVTKGIESSEQEGWK